MVNVKRTAEAVARMAMLKYFPSDPEARAALVGMACEIASTDAQVDWWVRRMLVLYNEWPGPKEMRACFCSRYKPKDGIEARSEKFIEGIPSEKLEEPMKALPLGNVASASPQLDRAVKLLARAKDMDRPARLKRPVAEVPTNPYYRPVTQADIDKAVQALRDKRGAAELAGERA